MYVSATWAVKMTFNLQLTLAGQMEVKDRWSDTEVHASPYIGKPCTSEGPQQKA